MKKSLIITLSALCAIVLYSTTFAQVKVATNGSVAIGTVNNPLTNARLQVVSGIGGYSVFSQTISIPTSSPMIRGLNTFSTATNPDFTWWGNDQTGVFHPANNVLAFTIGGAEKGRFSNGANAFTIIGSGFASGGFWLNSDFRYKKNIAEIKDPLKRILQLQGCTYEFKMDEYKSLSFNSGSNLGFIAQDLAKVFPEAVKADENGYLAVNYDMLVPVLVESIKSQQKIIESQNERISVLENNSSNYNNSNQLQSSAKLYQNTPNPFNASTTIKCEIPSDSKVSELYIYDMQGTQIRNIKITDKGSVSIVLRSGELKPGMYFYSLIIDNKEIDTKKMILTNDN
ncbi:tail fiber domain-containing protein [Fluviicola chungangensis]|uniref:T9SS type A sorting domain-containing protein n=1 Tax=Fluviicola chungangensis TaxID=2597671 RepID=A0A556MQW2_9FLAO|nr:tail fiber domain-containing protein [Fluviicola chungangensis]TSJ42307.1 T9SS type A sorting domain-containing protein [Fluviicola chungangensis]